ncbi:MAG: PEP-CTERM sorting domain-containing protein [Cyanothece sp. SIO1E1]|nr:PEP-CTERM sorting domain-containing protein [Cyanothece sp. SIO1E1]
MRQANLFSSGVALTTFAALSFSGISSALAGEFRTINGLDNNPLDPTLGEAETELLRLLDPAYDDGFSAPRVTGPTGNALPNPRAISNTVVTQVELVPNFLNASDWLWQWGQFIDHDLDLNEGGNEPLFIPVLDPSDPLFNPAFPVLPFTRVNAAEGTGTGPDNPRQQINEITSFIDGSNVYGSDAERASFLRTNDGTGKLKSQIIGGEELLPFNTAGLANANALGLPEESLFLAGDVRSNEQIGLIAAHTLFVREHNRLAEEIAGQLEAGEPEIVEKFAASGLEAGDFIYEAARKVVGAQIQLITYNEFLPLLIGDSLLAGYAGFDPTVDPSVSNEFANGAFRVGHTMLAEDIQRVDNDGNSVDSIFLGDAFFNPEEVLENGVDSLFQGLASQAAQEVDNMLVDGVRNFLFAAGTGGLDLASVNIQRGREVGLPGYNAARVGLGLDPATSFLTTETELGITSDPELAALFASIYESIDDVDLWLGGISEDAFNGGLVGELFHTIFVDQFSRLRDGDRFFFLNDLEHLFAFDPDIESTTLTDIIRRNSTITNIQDNAFVVASSSTEDVPEPSAMLSLLTLGALGASRGLRQRHKRV